LGFGFGFKQGLIHGFPLSGPESGHTERRCPREMIRVKRRKPFSSFRTVTVGFGITPNLLTLPLWGGRRSRAWALPPLPPVGTFTPP
jgi:hypothetical protein